MKILLVLLTFFSMNLMADEAIKWVPSSTLKVDIDCDGKPDQTMIGYKKSTVAVKSIISSSKKESVLEFGIGQPDREDALCGTAVELTSYEDTEEGLTELFGAVPEGFKNSKTCLSLTISAGECDPINMYWNHKSNQLDWWRM